MTTIVKGRILRQDQALWDGVEKNAIRKDSTGGTITGLVLGTEVDVLMSYGNGDSYTVQTIQNCTNRIGSASVTLVFNPGTWTIDQDLTIASNFTCRIPAGAVFNVSSGKTLTFSGPVIRDTQTWTSGSGTVTENGTRYLSGKLDLTGAVLQGTSALVFEGTTSDAFETTFSITDPTADRTIIIPDADVDLTGLVSASSTNNFTGIFNAKIPMATNFRLTPSVSGNALTVALKGLNGNDPSSSNHVYIPFRDVTSATGDLTWVDITAASSIVVASSKTLGTQNAIAARLWIVGFNNGGVLEMGIVNCYTNPGIFGIQSDTIASSTATPGNSAGVIYTTNTMTSKAMTVLGYIEATEATAGTWATTPSKTQPWIQGMKLPGEIVQIAYNQTGAVATGTTVLPHDDTIPQNNEGDQYMTQAITPLSAINILNIESQFYGSSSATNQNFTIALFQDSTANALAAVSNFENATARVHILDLSYRMQSLTVIATTFKIRAGSDTAGTTTFNGLSGGRIFGGIANSYLSIKEIMT